jgi:hypothetical protein
MRRPDPSSSTLAVHAAAFLLAALATTSMLLATSHIARAERACAQRAFAAHLARAGGPASVPAAAPRRLA